jgi:osmotically-inducible protein OsmY
MQDITQQVSKNLQTKESKHITLVWKNLLTKTTMVFKPARFVSASRMSQVTVASVLSATLLVSGCSTFIAANSGTESVGIAASDRTWGQIFADNSIEKTASINLYKLDPRFKLSRVNITCFHGVVLLTGQVPDANLKRLASDNVKAMDDVKAVQNYLTVGDEIGYDQIIQDGITTANVRKNFLLLKGFKDSRVKVVTENNVVFLMGKLPKSDVDWLLETLQRTPNIARIVTLIDILPEVAPSILETPIVHQSLTTNHGNDTTFAAEPTAVATPIAVEPTVTSQQLQQ